jgi:hypothetical protein
MDNTKIFNWGFYTKYYNLTHLKTEIDAFKHYILIGKNENKIINSNQINIINDKSK